VKRRVYTTRVHPLNDTNLPAISVYTGSETSQRMNLGVTDVIRQLALEIDVYVRETSKFDDDVDAIAVQVEEAMAGNFTLDGLAKFVVLTSTQIQFDGDADQILGVAKLTYSVEYVTPIDDVETAK